MAVYYAVVALLGTAVSFTLLVALHVLPTGIDPLPEPVSRYGSTRYKYVYRVGTIALGIAGIALALVLPPAVGVDTVIPTTGLVVFGLAQALISWFPDDATPGERSKTGQRHSTLVILFYGGISVAAFGFSSAFDIAPGFSSIALAGNVLLWVIIGADVVVLLTLLKPLRRFRGLAERLLHLPIFVWIVVVTIPLFSAPS